MGKGGTNKIPREIIGTLRGCSPFRSTLPYYTQNKMQCFGPDPDLACCWIRIQSGSGFFKWQNYFSKITIGKFCLIKTVVYRTVCLLKPLKWRPGPSSVQTWNFFLSSFLGEKFCPAGSGSFFLNRIRIRWPHKIRIQSRSETLFNNPESSVYVRKIAFV